MGKIEGCPVCLTGNIASFGQTYLESRFKSTLKVIADHPQISMHWCTKCETKFLMHKSEFLPANYFTTLLGDREYNRINHWMNSPLIVGEEFSKIVDQIGLNKNQKNEQLLPCAVGFKDGTSTSFGVLEISNRPPTGATAFYKDIRFIDEVDSLKVSEYAIPYQIRYAAQHAKEVESGFYPILASASGQKVVIDGAEMLFYEKGIKGSALQLLDETWDPKYANYLYSSHGLTPTYIIAKGC